MKDYKLNTYIEWTEEDRKRGECPVPDGSDVTVWFEDGSEERDEEPHGWDWAECKEEDYLEVNIIAYMIHSMPRELREWYVAKRDDGPSFVWECRQDAVTFLQWRDQPKDWEIIKVREVMEDES